MPLYMEKRGLEKKKGETALGPSKGWPTRFSRSGGHGFHIKKKELKKKVSTKIWGLV